MTAHQVRTSADAELALVEGASSGNLTKVRELLQQGTNPNRPIAQGSALGLRRSQWTSTGCRVAITKWC